MRFLQPSTKYFASSVTARASPSMGAYLDSAGWVNLLPTKVICQPRLQQNKSLEGQEQCF